MAGNCSFLECCQNHSSKKGCVIPSKMQHSTVHRHTQPISHLPVSRRKSKSTWQVTFCRGAKTLAAHQEAKQSCRAELLTEAVRGHEEQPCGTNAHSSSCAHELQLQSEGQWGQRRLMASLGPQTALTLSLPKSNTNSSIFTLRTTSYPSLYVTDSTHCLLSCFLST